MRSPEERRTARLYVAAMTKPGRELLVAEGLMVRADLTPKPNAGIPAARSIAAGMDAWWPKAGAR
jgi:hypothetical protein